jgi:UDP-N-acetylglucosamine/UDP-N-acetylgalactosamine diphosphorylase
MNNPSNLQEHPGLRDSFQSAGQGHVFAFWDQLDAEGRERLLGALASIDLGDVARFAQLMKAPQEHNATSFAPPQLFPADVRGSTLEDRAREAVRRGEEDFRAGRVGYLLVAGGQGSRLGFDGPKGVFPVGPVTSMSLFQLFAHKIRAAGRRYASREHGPHAHWWIMTSAANDAETQTFFDQQDFFGLDRERVHFFQQALHPALDADGRIVMATRDTPFLAPGGHGGVLSALATSGGLTQAGRAGVQRFSYFQVDNPLAHPADPLFIGLHGMEGAQMSTKVVAKRDAAEKVGVIGVADGKLGCIEYSDLPEDLREERTPDGNLRFGAGNTAIHVLERTFIEELTRGGDLHLPWHLARKKVAAVDAVGGTGAPVELEGVKFETFVFDALRSTTHSVTLEVDRKAQFSPVKNADGVDSPGTARADLCSLWSGWATAAGLELPPADAAGIHPVEIDPLVADDRETFLQKAPAPEIRDGGHVYR